MRLELFGDAAMPAALCLLLIIADPRGRCNRRGLAVLALALLAVQTAAVASIWAAGAPLDGPVAIALKLGFVWLALAAASKRLHDTGRSAWWIVWCLVGILVWSTILATALLIALGDRILAPGSGGFETHFILTMLPVIAATLWLHFAQGETCANRFGPCPEGHGLSQPTGRAVAPAVTMQAPATA